MQKILFLIICLSSLLLGQTNANKDFIMHKGEVEIGYYRYYNENSFSIKYGLTENIELLPIGFKYRYKHNSISQFLFQMNLLGISAGTFASNVDINGTNIDQDSSSVNGSYISTRILNKIAYKLTPLNNMFSTQLEYSYLYNLSNNSDYENDSNIHHISIEQFYAFYEDYTLSIKAAYLKEVMWDEQTMLDLNLYLPVHKNFDIVLSFNSINRHAIRTISPYTYNLISNENDTFYGFQVLYKY